MPRGGSRPGAGAPRGNFNGVRTGNGSHRMRRVYKRLGDVVHSRADLIGMCCALRDAGFFVPRGHRMVFNGDIRGVVEFLHHLWFEDWPAQSYPVVQPPKGSSDADSPAPLASSSAPRSEKTRKLKSQSNRPPFAQR